MTYKAQIDETACTAHGDCEAITPEVFRVGDTAVVIGTGPDELILEARTHLSCVRDPDKR